MTPRHNIHIKNLEKIFYPGSVAVVGTNNSKGTVPYDIFFNILKAEFTGVLYPVSPGEKSICSVKAYKYIVDIPDQVDLAILVFPSSVCHLALEQCGQKGIRSVVIISAGFKETGEKGLERERQLKQIAGKYDISFIGPNCLGIINTDPRVNLNASFARKMPEEGNIGFLSQCGALCTAVLDYARAKHIGFSKFISFGNKADISEIDLLFYLRNDDKTKVILLYLEEVTDGSALMQVAREIIATTGKPILILKSGKTTAGASATASHTGSLAGSDEICDAAFRQAGIIRCANIEEMFNIAIAFAYQPLPKSNKVAIITNAGVEVIPGFKRDPSFGGVIMFGIGGIFVELYRDVSFRIAPLTEADAESMIHEIKAFGLLDGMRGMKKSDVSSIKSCILRLSQLTLGFPRITELDINPLIVHEDGKGCWVADAKIML